ncbi:MAG: Thymidylate synthase ThyX [Firmicutes bacterium ADurb.Bin248]|nr:MAG: Thymidylate synthase ThyX [Firmicutes bacterium ADurb.Bin248]HOG00628.1 FAD-dependent thymidylate synthase [Clostridia bacterium]HPK14659.1 FAD-dependent thymidylate synthase [Clostridia bacterium]
MPSTRLEVRLLSHTPEPEQTVALAGRLCYSDSGIPELREAVAGNAAQFVEKLMKLGHLSPLEHASFTFGAEGVSRALLAQITRHRIASFSVQSQRYVKQGEARYVVPPCVEALGADAVAEFARQMETAQEFYRYWLARGLKAEDARFVLPNAAETRMVFTMNARELLHFFSLRCCNRAQWEIRALAWAMLGMCLREAPAIFGNAGPGCVSADCTEGSMSCGDTAFANAMLNGLRAAAARGASDQDILQAVTRLI